MIERQRINHIDWFLLTITLTLAAVGIATIYSATYSQDSAVWQRQIFWLLLGSLVMVPAVMVDYSVFGKFAYILLGASVATLVIALIFGRKVSGAQRWLSLGFVSIQPSEFAKIAFTIALSKYLSEKEPLPDGLGFRELIIPAAIFAVPFLLIAKQPDLGTALIFLFVLSSMLLIVKIRTRTLVTLVAAAGAAVPFAWRFLKDYQKARLLSFTDPAMDPLGTGYHLVQSKIAIGSGGFFGKGFTESTQGNLMFLPAHHTDFIFPILAEEWGFVGSIAVTALFGLLVVRGINIAGGAKDRFGFLLAFGITSLVFWHAVINMGMVIGLLPVVGVPMPFMSYGGSFLLTMLLGIALLLNVRMRSYIF
ncbi:MAG: rod shape-determining protein RodA [Deltaproteobacteria bacterium]|nr:rod shape-determining protein RodA [Deltaproteobacteria bacterium]